MKKSIISEIFTGAMIFSMALATTACGNGQNEVIEAPVLADVASSITDIQEQSTMTYMSPNGFQMRYNPAVFESNEIDENTQTFVYIGESAGTNMLTVYYKENMSPEEALSEIMSSWDTKEEISKSEITFPGTTDKHGYWRMQGTDGPAGSKIYFTAIAGEFNGGTLMFETFETQGPDEEMSMAVSDGISEIINSITYDKFDEQTVFAGSDDKTDANAEIPAYEYSGYDEKDRAVFNYMSTEIGSYYPETDVKIPNCMVAGVDESDENNVKVYGEFWVFGYNVDGDTLICENGGQHIGCMHLKKNDDLTYTVTSYDETADGSKAVASRKELFGDYYSALEKILANEENREMLRAEIIRGYVHDNGLNITKYQDYGWLPVELN